MKLSLQWPPCWCTSLESRLGQIHFHTRLWAPRGRGRCFYIPPETRHAYEIDLDQMARIAKCSTVLEIMAIVRPPRVD